MLASITPLGERSRRQHWRTTVTFLVAGAIAGGAFVGAALAAIGGTAPLGPAARTVAVVVVGAAGLLHDVRVGGIRLPTHRRQVDDTWLRRYRGWVYGLGFGAQLGAGAATIVTTSAVYVALAAELLAPTVAGGVAIGALFGLVRGSTVLAGAGVDSPEKLARFHRTLDAAAPRAARAAVAAQALVLAAAAATL